MYPDLDDYLPYSDALLGFFKRKTISTYDVVMDALFILKVIRRLLG